MRPSSRVLQKAFAVRARKTSQSVSDCEDQENAAGTRLCEYFLFSQVDTSAATNALDRWIAASTRTLTAFVRQEMAAYRLYTVVPRLVKFIDDLTNVYVRYNRKRLKGGKSPEDCSFALASLYQVLLTLCKVRHGFRSGRIATSASTPWWR